MKTLTREMLGGLDRNLENPEKNFNFLNELYFPEKDFESPGDITNAYSRKNSKFQRLLKGKIRKSNTIVEIGCGSGDFTIPLANKFPHKKFIAIEPHGAIVYAALKRDLHNIARGKREYFELSEKYIPETFRTYDRENHPFFFNKINNLEFRAISSFDSTIKEADFAFASFVANNYYWGSTFTGELAHFFYSVQKHSKKDYMIIDGNFKSRGCSDITLKVIRQRLGLNFKRSGDHFCFYTK